MFSFLIITWKQCDTTVQTKTPGGKSCKIDCRQSGNLIFTHSLSCSRPVKRVNATCNGECVARAHLSIMCDELIYGFKDDFMDFMEQLNGEQCITLDCFYCHGQWSPSALIGNQTHTRHENKHEKNGNEMFFCGQKLEVNEYDDVRENDWQNHSQRLIATFFI